MDQLPPIFTWIIWLLIIWVLPWKAARLSQKGWYITLFLVNTLGILDIIYIFVVAKKGEKEVSEKKIN